MRGRVGMAVTVGATLALSAPAMAGTAATRFAEPNGNGPEPCEFADPCDIQVAVEAAPDGSPVSLAEGTYILGDELQVDGNVDVTGVGAPDETILITSATIGVHVVFSSPGTFLQSFTIAHQPQTGPSFGLQLENGTAEFVKVDSSGDYACFTAGVIRSSTCINSNSVAGVGAGLFSPVAATGKLRNVTAVSLGTVAGYGVYASATGAGNFAVTLDGRNVIAQGATYDQGGNNSNTSATSHIDLDYSNFNTLNFTNTGASGTGPGTLNNQEDVPLLDTTTWQQLPGSVTIDAGSGSVTDHPSLDFDLEPRNQNGIPDIGADESDGSPPDTAITKKPPKRTTKRTGTFEFESAEAGAGFECKLDSKPFAPCDSGRVKYKRLARKKHTFQVRAVDGFENADSTPAKYVWKVKKRRR
jgi:hypothetical protein